jgi:HSP20 family molecular chaperone IbpA
MDLSGEHSHRIRLYQRQERVQHQGFQCHHHEVHALFEELIHRPWGIGCWTPAVDVWEKDDAFIIEMDLPGVVPDQVRIRTQDRTLIVEGQRQLRQNVSQVAARRHERCEGRFARRFEFDYSLEGREIESQWQDGVLTLNVPKPK